MSILFLEPVLKETIWGGTRLHDYQCQFDSDHVGEAWAISAHKNGDCQIKNGEYIGKTLSWLWDNHRELLDDVGGDVFPLLTKIIDANDDLSIQVHPDDSYAKEHENGSLGKTECWYILDAKEGGTIVIGHNATSKEEMREMIENKRWSEFIREVPVKKGDFFQITPGTVHAIKGGTVILETQQNSDITYRVYDYDRLSDGKPRELHLEKSMDVIEIPYKDCSLGCEATDNAEGSTKNNCFEQLVACDYYSVWKAKIDSAMDIIMDQHFMLISVIEGSGTIDGERIAKGDHFILLSDTNCVNVDGDMEWIVSAVR